MYLTYEEYHQMGGTLSQSDFDFYGYEVESIIDWYTFNRLKGNTVIPQEVKDCEFYLIMLAQARLNALGVSIDSTSGTSYSEAVLTGQSNDGVSVQYNYLPASTAIQSLKDEMGDVIKRRLQGVVNELGRKLLYRGLYPNE